MHPCQRERRERDSGKPEKGDERRDEIVQPMRCIDGGEGLENTRARERSCHEIGFAFRQSGHRIAPHPFPAKAERDPEHERQHDARCGRQEPAFHGIADEENPRKRQCGRPKP